MAQNNDNNEKKDNGLNIVAIIEDFIGKIRDFKIVDLIKLLISFLSKIKLKLIIIGIIIGSIVLIILAVMTWGTVKEIFDKVKETFTDINNKVTIVDNNIEIDQAYWQEAEQKLRQMGVSTTSLGLNGDEELLQKILEAEIVTYFPYLGGDDLQGTVYFERATVDGNKTELQYISKDDFYNRLNSGDSSLINYFTLDEEDWTVHVIKNSNEGINQNNVEKIDYRSMVNKYAMPFEFPLALALITQNPNFILAVIDLAQESRMVVTIAESKVVTRTVVKESYTETKTVTNRETGQVLDSYTTSKQVEQTVDDYEEVEYSTNILLSSVKAWAANQVTDLTPPTGESYDAEPIIEDLPNESSNAIATMENSGIPLLESQSANFNLHTEQTNKKQTTEVTTTEFIWREGIAKTENKLSNFIELIINDNLKSNEVAENKEDLEDNINNYISTTNQGDWSVSVRSSTGTEIVSINNSEQKADGFLKLFIMAAAYNEVNEGNIEEDEVTDYIERMIINDSNEAANSLITIIGNQNSENQEEESATAGLEIINKFIQDNDYAYTNIGNLFIVDNVSSIGVEGNYTSVRGVTYLLNSIYNKQCVNREYSKKMLEILNKNETFTTMIPSTIPTDIQNRQVYNKTEELLDVRADSAYVKIGNVEYTIAVKGTNITDKMEAENIIKQISTMVYQYFNEQRKIPHNDVNGIDTVMDGNRVCYWVPDQSAYVSPLTNLVDDGAEMLFELLASSEKTQNHELVMRYVLYLATGKDYGVTNPDIDIFGLNTFQNTGSLFGGLNTFKEYLHAWEGNTGITEDGKYYIVGDDGAGHPTVGYGIDIYNSGYLDRFLAAGYDVSIGSKIPVEFVDALENEEIQKALQLVESKTSGLNLTQYQKYALVSRVYNCGSNGAFRSRNGKTFVEAYKAYWNPESDDKYGESSSDSIFNHLLYTQYMSMPNTSNGQYMQGLENRRKSEWLLFTTGYYDRINSWCSVTEAGDSATIVQKAVECHKYLRENGFYYAQAGRNIPITGNSRTIDCSSYVSWVLYEAGYTEFAGYQTTSSGFNANRWGWQTVSVADAQPGDILVYSGHVEIVAANEGGNKFRVYNCGGNDSINAEGTAELPESSMSGRTKSSVLKVLRPPTQ